MLNKEKEGEDDKTINLNVEQSASAAASSGETISLDVKDFITMDKTFLKF